MYYNAECCKSLIIDEPEKLESTLRILPVFLVSYDLGLFSILIKNNKMSFRSLVTELNIGVRPTRVILSVCTIINLIKVDNEEYSLTKQGIDLFQSHTKNKSLEIFNALINHYQVYSFEGVKDAIINDRPQVYDKINLFEKNVQDLSCAEYFTELMHIKSVPVSEEFIELISLTDNKTFLDIGGGSGVFTTSVCNRWKHLTGIIFDLPTICDVADKFVLNNTKNKNVIVKAGDMWTDNFPAADVHFYSDILHDWSLEKVNFLLKKSYESLPQGGNIFINEMLFNQSKTGPYSTVMYNLSMLLWTEGQQFSYNELHDILINIGFINVQRIDYKRESSWSIITAEKS